MKTDYVAVANILGKNYTGKGLTPLEAISNIAPGIARGRTILTVEHDGVKRERILMPMLTVRLFNTRGITRDVALKNASLLFT